MNSLHQAVFLRGIQAFFLSRLAMISGGNVLRLKSKVMAVLDFRADGDCKEGPANVCFPSFSAFFKARASLPSAKEVSYSLKKCLLTEAGHLS